jgi:hypothetical protein
VCLGVPDESLKIGWLDLYDLKRNEKVEEE